MMNYQLTREIFDPYTNDSLGNFGPYVQYKIWDGEDQLGEFYYKNITSYFLIGGKEFRISGEKDLFRKTNFDITDIQKNIKIGSFTKSFWRYLLKNEIGAVIFSDSIYICTRTFFETLKNPLFSSEKKVSLKFLLQNERHTTSFSMVYNTLSDGEGSNSYKPISGFSCQILSSNNDYIPLLTCLFLIEKHFDY